MEASTRKLRNVTLTLALVAAVTVVGALLLHPDNEDTTGQNGPGDSGPFPNLLPDLPLPVEADTARIGTLVVRISATGLTRARREVVVSAKIAGLITRLPVREGQWVRQGDLLVQLDDREYRLALEEAEDALLQAMLDYGERVAERKHYQEEGTTYLSSLDVGGAKRNLEEVKGRHRRGEASEMEVKIAEMEVQAAQFIANPDNRKLQASRTGLTKALINKGRADLNLAYTQIRAPFSGRIADLNVHVGQQVGPGQECMKLVDLSRMEVDVQVLESEVGSVEVGRNAEVTFSAYPGEIFPGRVVSINPLIDPETRTCRVTVQLADHRKRIFPGMFASVKLEAQIYPNRFLIPKKAIVLRDQRKVVFVVRQGPEGEQLAKWCYVTTGLENKEYAEVLDSAMNLKPGEPVIVSGHYTLVHDARVRVLENRK